MKNSAVMKPEKRDLVIVWYDQEHAGGVELGNDEGVHVDDQYVRQLTKGRAAGSTGARWKYQGKVETEVEECQIQDAISLHKVGTSHEASPEGSSPMR